MKSIYLFCTKIWFYLTEIPVLILLWVAIAHNGSSSDLFGFYPLIIFLILTAIFLAVYFFRMISISTDEIRYHGLFSSRDRDFIKENRTLVIAVMPAKNLRVELWGDAGREPAFDWMKPEDVEYRDICLFRGRALGGGRTVKKIAKYFTVPEDKLESLLSDGYEFENNAVRVTTEQEDNLTYVKIHFNITIV